MTDNINNIPLEEEDDGIIYLEDEDGNEIAFEFLDSVEYEGETYVVLMPMEEDPEHPGDVVILQVISESDDEDTLAGIDDEGILDAVFDLFKKQNKDVFDFED